ncbi:hypothetical protein CSW65_07235 [Streptococcus agalactiae]|uniref:Phage protein n=3 Tax=Streptococcus agalactiae TaxID=1311 RepID=A0A7Z7KD92_STRAG|nr:YopX family protein [Streptococcus agalactiae]PHU31172.1 hypothetical protein CSW65_05055 [Streptococcus agalactiae]PHU31545.1 hypothetical protein CSW65_07235 [Streptococcus agalactiae]SQA20313.1 phage protein [Streptococcus agalactiae]SUN11666.1 phage protein [Streptococcus agalactiae]
MIPNFRAFNKKTKKMYSIDGFKSSERKIYRCSLADDEFRSGRLETFHFVEDNLDNYILMQSTGLKDKEETEIFEGDVVRHIDFLLNNETVNKVYFKDGLFMYDVVVDEYTYDVPIGEIIENSIVEVIGNIYENPELLESVEE